MARIFSKSRLQNTLGLQTTLLTWQFSTVTFLGITDALKNVLQVTTTSDELYVMLQKQATEATLVNMKTTDGNLNIFKQPI